jgi:hypothetical protein
VPSGCVRLVTLAYEYRQQWSAIGRASGLTALISRRPCPVLPNLDSGALLIFDRRPSVVKRPVAARFDQARTSSGLD